MGSCCPARCLHVSLSLQHWFQIIAQTLLIKDTSSTRLRGWIREEPAARYDELPATLTVLAAEDIADSIDALYHKDEAMAELKSEVMEALDDDSWMFAASRSRINLVSSPGKKRTQEQQGAYLPKQHVRETLGAGAGIQENKELLGCRCLRLQEASSMTP
ncbi:uncharacterized protein LOC110431257 [Sorghum bicolor]|uniref:uncharacterized protein LOC110431257 n=1 Tax=Sorghum bicolor TaxID=4558 RepID=UPI0007F19951|nr:uncharacterized protein LOC110431257 [Sorghum bicolor]|eukprot:XP_021305824.1 uncharacterized protein LOC110431257 [Sorghum bicolor]